MGDPTRNGIVTSLLRRALPQLILHALCTCTAPTDLAPRMFSMTSGKHMCAGEQNNSDMRQHHERSSSSELLGHGEVAMGGGDAPPALEINRDRMSTI
mmetsp:Transcript_61541/g.102408  ORF Transcript_61541/g.102408 Transcript_61541/m.102408 type:complete len:98 (-) Transcript_61541:185-478(-)